MKNPEAARHVVEKTKTLYPTPPSQAAPFIKPSVPLELLPAGSTNGTKADAFQQGKSTVFPTGPQVSVPLNPLYDVERNMGPVLPWSDPRIGKTVPGCAPEQVSAGNGGVEGGSMAAR